MERSADDGASSRVRELLDRIPGPWEVAAITAVTIAVWRIAFGWDWSSIPSADPLRSVAPQSGTDRLILGFAVAAGVGWLAWRGYGVAGTASIWLSVILLSGWRLSVSAVLGWPIDLAALIFFISVICIVAASLGTWMHHCAARRAGDDMHDEPPQPVADIVTTPAASAAPRR